MADRRNAPQGQPPKQARPQPKPQSQPPKQAQRPQPKPQAQPQKQAQRPQPKPQSQPPKQAQRPQPKPQSHPPKQAQRPQPKPQGQPPKQAQRPQPKPQGQPPKQAQRSQPQQQPPRDERRVREADRAAKRAMERREAAPVQKRRRGGDYRYYWMLFFILAAVVFAILAQTVLFNCEEIITEGTVRYTSEQIAAASGLKKGDNLIKVNKKKAAESVVAALNYIDTAQVTKIFPTKLKITVVEAEKWFAVSDGGACVAVSRAGKMIDSYSGNDLVKVIGYEPMSLVPGGWLESAVSGKNDIPEEILNAADKAGLDLITEIDMTDRFAIVIRCGEKITLEIGNITEIEAKLIAAKKIIETEVEPGAEVIIRLDDPEKVALKHVNNEPVFIPASKESTSESTAQASADS